MVENWFHSGDAYEEAKMAMRKVNDFFKPDIQVILDAMQEAYEQGVRDGKQEA